MLFTPNNSGQRSPPTYYRGCWHVVSRGFLIKYRHSDIIPYIRRSSFITEVYRTNSFFLHAALLGQGSPHCRKFPTAASRRSLGRVSVPVWPVTLSGRLRIVALVSRYLTNQLMRHKSILYQCLGTFNMVTMQCPYLCGLSCRFQQLSPCLGQVTYVLLTRSPLEHCCSRSTCMY